MRIKIPDGYLVVSDVLPGGSISSHNPAVTLARAFTDTFSGIAPQNVGAFVVAQIAGALAALAIAPLLWPREQTAEKLSC